MKKALVVMLLVLGAAYCSAGSFFVNIAVLNAREGKVVSMAESLGLKAYVATVKDRPGFSLLCDERADSQDLEYGVALAKRFSSAAASPVVYTLVHDSDILIFQVIHGGRTIFSLDSWPGYFEGDDPVPDISGLEEAAKLFEVDAEGLRAILDRSSLNDYVFAEERLLDILEYLGLPECIACCGYGIITEVPELIEEFGLAVTKIE